MHNITYTYDPVGNITRISNSAGGADGLGGKFTYNYSYDDLYRLETSAGNSAVNASYTLAMEYSPSGNILKKTLAATKQLLGNSTTDSYENVYSYSGAHKLEQVFEVNGLAPDRNFFFDPNGNMLYQEFFDPNSGPNNRYLCWDEENRLSATRDNNYVTANIYDASGNRAWKLAGEMNWMWQNGSGFQGYGDLNLRTWYQSELMTITDVGFTKHYFIAGQRIASKLGESLNNADVQPLRENHVAPLTENYKVLSIGAAERMRRDFECLGLDYNNFTPGEPAIQVLDELAGIGDANESNIFFYHSDHLGSSSFLTDGGGVATQHLQYLPFGEDLVHQQNTAAYYTPYTFSGKERDMETGLSYFGARYYDAGLSIWLSVDPMSDERPSLSPFNYCQWNPVRLIDPTGMLDEEAGGTGNGSGTKQNQNSQSSNQQPKNETDKKPVQLITGIPNNSSNEPSNYVELPNNNPNTNTESSSTPTPLLGEGNGWVGPTLIGISRPLNVLKPVGMLGSSRGSSIASVGLSKLLPFRSPYIKTATRFLTGGTSSTAVLGRAMGRLSGPLGYSITGIDLLPHANSFFGRPSIGFSGKRLNYTPGICFIAGTKIYMADETERNIEQIKIGDSIKTYNLVLALVENNIVLRIDSPVHYDLIEISFSDGTSNTNTFDHPYFVKGKGWSSFEPKLTNQRYGLQVYPLEVGDTCLKVIDIGIEEVVVRSIVKKIRKEKTYNLTHVAGNNNFFANRILVHNKYNPQIEEDGFMEDKEHNCSDF